MSERDAWQARMEAKSAERQARLAYVAEHGGTTWCAAEARKQLEKETRKKLDAAL